MRKNPVFDTQIFLFLAHFLLHDEVNDGCYDQSKDDDLDVFCIFADLLIQLIFGHDGVQIPAHSSQHTMPSTSTDGGEEDELTIVPSRSFPPFPDSADTSCPICCWQTYR